MRTASEHHVGHGMARSVHVIHVYSTRLALFIMAAKRKREVRSAVPVRESSIQLVIYSLDTCIRYSTYNILIFKSQKGSMEALSFLVITS